MGFILNENRGLNDSNRGVGGTKIGLLDVDMVGPKLPGLNPKAVALNS